MMTKVHGTYSNYNRNVSFIFEKEINGKVNVARIGENGILFWEEHDPLEHTNPTITLTHQEAQELIDVLYKLGFNPAEKPPLENELTAVRAHLKDMRNIVDTFMDAKVKRHEKKEATQ